MADTNEIRFSGTIERLQSVNTRTGKSMATWLLKVGQDRFKCVCFGNLAATGSAQVERIRLFRRAVLMGGLLTGLKQLTED